MPRGSKHKERLLKLLYILESESDEQHRWSSRMLLARLGNEDPTENDFRNVRNDIKMLREAGYRIDEVRHKAPEYYLGKRRFNPEELEVLVDVVQSARSLTERMSDELVDSILALGSEAQAKDIRRSIRAGNRVKMANEEIFHNIRQIRTAIRRRKKLLFRYFNYGFDLERVYHTTPDGKKSFVETPLMITYVDGGYYVITFKDGAERPNTRRIDRMENVLVTDEMATWRKELQEYDIDDRAVFGMFIGKEETVQLRARVGAMNALVDRFGDSMKIEKEADGEHAIVTVRVVRSPQFKGWLHGMEDLLEEVRRSR